MNNAGYGEMTSQMTSFNDNDKVMYAHLPTKGTTLYSIIQDTFVYLCLSFVLIFMVVYMKMGFHQDI